MYGWIGSNCMMICKRKHRQFNAHLHFPFNCVTRGWEFIISTAKCCLFRLTELQPGEYLFSILGRKFFLYSSCPLREPCVVFESVLLLCYFSPSSMSSKQILGGNLFTEKNYPMISASDQYNK